MELSWHGIYREDFAMDVVAAAGQPAQQSAYVRAAGPGVVATPGGRWAVREAEVAGDRPREEDAVAPEQDLALAVVILEAVADGRARRRLPSRVGTIGGLCCS